MCVCVCVCVCRLNPHGTSLNHNLMEDVALSRTLRARSRPVCLRAAVVTSSRRWERDGIARTIVLMWRLRLEYALGADPERLARLYRGG